MKTIVCNKISVWDGGDRHNFGYYLNSEVSKEDITAYDKHCLIESQVLTVFDSIQEVIDNSTANLRKRAWEKLSPQERIAVGFREEPK